jgi:signal peptidase I
VDEHGRVLEAERGSRLRQAAPVASLLAWLYLYLLIWLGAWILVSSALLGWHPVVITGGSMSPQIQLGDVVMLADARGEVEAGLVITYPDPVRPGALVTHRIDRVLEDGTYRTRGDANRVPDPAAVDPSEILGVGRLLVPAIGLPAAWIQRGSFGLLAVWVAFTALAAWLALSPTGRGTPRRRDHKAAPSPALPAAELVERC